MVLLAVLLAQGEKLAQTCRILKKPPAYDAVGLPQHNSTCLNLHHFTIANNECHSEQKKAQQSVGPLIKTNAPSTAAASSYLRLGFLLEENVACATDQIFCSVL
jgi:hypothetical protein